MRANFQTLEQQQIDRRKFGSINDDDDDYNQDDDYNHDDDYGNN